MDKIPSKYTPGEAQEVMETYISQHMGTLKSASATLRSSLDSEDVLVRVAAARVICQMYELLDVSENVESPRLETGWHHHYYEHSRALEVSLPVDGTLIVDITAKQNVTVVSENMNFAAGFMYRASDGSVIIK